MDDGAYRLNQLSQKLSDLKAQCIDFQDWSYAPPSTKLQSKIKAIEEKVRKESNRQCAEVCEILRKIDMGDVIAEDSPFNVVPKDIGVSVTPDTKAIQCTPYKKGRRKVTPAPVINEALIGRNRKKLIDM